MKRFLILGFLLIATPVYAWVGPWDTGRISASLLGAGVSLGGVSTMATGSTAIPLAYSVVKKIMSGATNQAGTMADGVPGQVITVMLTERSSSGNFILTPTTKTGFSNITFNTVGDTATFLFVDGTVGWIILGETGTVY